MKLRPRHEPSPEPEIRALLEARARRLAEVPKDEQDGALAWLAELPVGNVRYALPLEMLAAALPLRRVTPVPLARPEVVGILRQGAAVITVFSLAALLGARGWRRDPEVLLVLELPGGRRVAFDCEETPRPITLPAHLLDGGHQEGAVRDLALPDGRTLHLLDPERLLGALERGAHAG